MYALIPDWFQDFGQELQAAWPIFVVLGVIVPVAIKFFGARFRDAIRHVMGEQLTPIKVEVERISTDVKNLQEEIGTNHGKRASEYLEMIQAVHENQVQQRQRAIELHELILEHTEQDAENFSELREMVLPLIASAAIASAAADAMEASLSEGETSD